MIKVDDLVFVLGVEPSADDKVGGYPEDGVFYSAVALILDDAFGPLKAHTALTTFNPLADFIEVPIGCTKARVDLRPIRSAVAPLVRQAA